MKTDEETNQQLYHLARTARMAVAADRLVIVAVGTNDDEQHQDLGDTVMICTYNHRDEGKHAATLTKIILDMLRATGSMLQGVAEVVLRAPDGTIIDPTDTDTFSSALVKVEDP